MAAEKSACQTAFQMINIARIANAVPVALYLRVTVNIEIVVLNCLKCNQCLKGHKSLGLFCAGVLQLSLSLYFSLYMSLALSFCWSGHVSLSLWSKVSKVTSLLGRSLRVFSKCICHCACLCHCVFLCPCLFVGQVMSPHHSHRTSQGSLVSQSAVC